MLLAIFRHHAQSQPDRFQRRTGIDLDTFKPDFSLAAPRIGAKQSRYQFGAAGANQAGDAEDLAAPQ